MKVLSFGELLWDVYPEKKVIGGAALNFSAHLVKNGVEAHVYTAVGQDELGKEAIEICKGLKLDTKYIHCVPKDTGVSMVTVKDGSADFDIIMDSAMDHIPYVPVTEYYDAFYFGTLAQRCPESRKSLWKVLEGGNFGEVYLDINIRQTYYSKELLEKCLPVATILKVSREEVGVLKETGICMAEGYENIARDLCAKYPKIGVVIITLDADGAFVYEKESGKALYSEKPNCTVVSAVGGGDSFSGAFLASYLKGEGIEAALKRASKVSAYVVTQIDAVPEYPEGF